MSDTHKNTSKYFISLAIFLSIPYLRH